MKYVCKIEGKLKWDNPKDLEKMISEIKENKDKITSIELCHNSIGIECAKKLSEAISELKNLNTVNYRDLFVSRLKEDLPISLKYLMEALLNKNIKFIDLSDNAFGPTAIPSFDFFLKEIKTLEYLELENNGLGPEGAESVCEALLQNNNIKLKTIKINRNRLENKGGKSLAKVINKMGSIEHLELFQNGINSEGMEEIFKALKNNLNLKVLKLNDNVIKNSCEIFIDVLKDLKNIKILDVSDSIIGNKYGIELFKVMENLKIEEIYCNYNEIEDENSQKLILDSAKKNKNIKILEIKGNEMNKSVYNEYVKEFQNLEKFECYSDDEEDFNEEKEEDNINEVTKKVNEIDLNN